MLLRYISNVKLAKELLSASKPKLKNDQGLRDAFESFNLSPDLVRVVGVAESVAAVLFGLSIFNKKLSQVGSFITIIVLGVAIQKHMEAGHGKEGAQHAIDLVTMAGLSLADTIVSSK
ncbi:DoxX family protein [Staphylococcus hyicus]|uniref:DoxX family protein n=2 Tax=Staphylococcus hyicus TaxID=1284 RepID=A0ACD5FQK7_STAHY|nr:DoxX family protein [Staphylococcus hyicus]MCE5153947.1 DoxX family protein [Staphylococcus hyicus]MCQ9291401.1 DoxX family protein [Staphylococcus hyicus]MCQ9300298.1 DoxX family protein [Staphylococcus hyicus]MCQ9306642.1 DoxX family protein [Staphylococcus hyicus]MCQ9309055.1 DoxX family protein [Staphylococcus hyicus]